MRKLFKFATFGLTASLLPLCLATTASATSTIGDDIDTKLEYQVSSDGSAIRYISTMELKNSRTLDDISKIDVSFTFTNGETTKESKIFTQTTVYDRITGTKDEVDDTYYAVFKITDLTTDYTGWTITPNFKYYFTDSTTEDATASSWLIGNARLYFVKTDSEWGNNIHAYMFETDSNYNEAWPGAEMTYDALNNMYYYDYALGEHFGTVIFNDGTRQTGNTPISSQNIYYVQNGDEALPHPTASHSIVHNNNTHYCEYCHFSERHSLTATLDEVTGMKHVTCSECDFEADLDPNLFYFTNVHGWSSVNVHMWGGTAAGTEWPGVAATKVGTNEYNQDVYCIDTTGYKKIIFNGGGRQTVDINLDDYSAYNAFYPNNGDGNLTVGCYIYIPENNQE